MKGLAHSVKGRPINIYLISKILLILERNI